MLCRVGRLAMLLRAVPCHLLPLWGDEQFPFFSSSSSFWEQRRQRQPVERGVLFPSLPFISLLIRQSILLADSGARCLPAYPARPLLHRHPAPVAAVPCRLDPQENKDQKCTFLFHFLHRRVNIPTGRGRKGAAAIFVYYNFFVISPPVLRRENLTNLKIYDIIYLQGEGRKMNHLHHHLHYA